MINVRRSHERRHDHQGRQDTWLTSMALVPEDPGDPTPMAFGSVEALNEELLRPGAVVSRRCDHDVELVTYVFDGSITCENSTGSSGVMQTGEFQRMTGARGLRYKETNLSQKNGAHLFHLWLRPTEKSLSPAYELKRFSAAERGGILCAVASFDGRAGSLRVHVDAVLYSVVLETGQHIAHALGPTRRAWLHVVSGEARAGDAILTQGDSLGLYDERSVSFTARERSEVLLADIAADGVTPSA